MLLPARIRQCRVNDGALPTLSIAIMAHPSRRSQVDHLLKILGPVPVAYDEGCGLAQNAANAWAMADPACDYHLVLQDDSVLADDFVMKARRFLATCPLDATISFHYRHKAKRPSVARLALKAFADGVDPFFLVACLKRRYQASGFLNWMAFSFTGIKYDGLPEYANEKE